MIGLRGWQAAFATVFAFAAWSAPLVAAPIQYVFSGTASGTLGGTPFTNASVTITASGNTSNIPDTVDCSPTPGLICNGPLTVTFTIGGAGSGTITDGLFLFVNQTTFPPALGLEHSTGGGDFIDVGSASFGTYDAASAIGPLSVSQFFVGAGVATTAGNLSFTTTPGTFQAIGGGGGGGGTAPAFTNGPPPNGTVNASYNFAYTASGTPPITFSVTSGALPTGLTLSNGGTISGPPTAIGTFSGVVTASNGIAPDATQSFSITISALPPPPPPVVAQPIPTLGELAIVMLVAMLAVVGWRRMRKP